MSEYQDFAERELGSVEGNEMATMIKADVMELLDVFDKQGHSGHSAHLCVSLFKRLALLEPIGPLTGSDSEWNEIGDGEYQNNRCSHVFKDSTGTYDSTGRIFEEPDGCRYQNSESRVYITFPYTPKTEIVKRPRVCSES